MDVLTSIITALGKNHIIVLPVKTKCMKVDCLYFRSKALIKVWIRKSEFYCNSYCEIELELSNFAV